MSEHFLQRSEQEINHLRAENASLKNLLNALNKQTTMPKLDDNENEKQALSRQIKLLQVIYIYFFFDTNQ